MRAVIVDSDITTQTILTMVFEAEGVTVSIPHDTDEILSFAPGIIMIDRLHPIFTPQNLHILHDEIQPHPIIIALDTMHGFLPNDVPHVSSWLQKPFTAQQVKQIISSVVS